MLVMPAEGKTLTVSETGFGRVSENNNYRLQKRGGKGLLNYHVERYGDVAAVIPIDTEQDLMLISQTGILIRIPAAAVRLCVTLRWLP